MYKPYMRGGPLPRILFWTKTDPTGQSACSTGSTHLHIMEDMLKPNS